MHLILVSLKIVTFYVELNDGHFRFFFVVYFFSSKWHEHFSIIGYFRKFKEDKSLILSITEANKQELIISFHRFHRSISKTG